MIVQGTNLKMTKGDTEAIRVTINGYSLTEGDFIEMTVRHCLTKEVILYKKITKFTENSALIQIEPEDTNNLWDGSYVYDIQLTYNHGTIKTIIEPSEFIIGKEVTYAEG